MKKARKGSEREEGGSTIFSFIFTLALGFRDRNNSWRIKHTGNVKSHSNEDCRSHDSALAFWLTVPVQLEDDGAVHDGEPQEANPPQEDTAEHAGVEVQDHDLLEGNNC